MRYPILEQLIRKNIVKTIFVCNRQQTEFYLYVTSHDKPFVTRDLLDKYLAGREVKLIKV